jgi:hypothetical protein
MSPAFAPLDYPEPLGFATVDQRGPEDEPRGY